MQATKAFVTTFAELGTSSDPMNNVIEGIERFTFTLFGEKCSSCVDDIRWKIFGEICQGVKNHRPLFAATMQKKPCEKHEGFKLHCKSKKALVHTDGKMIFLWNGFLSKIQRMFRNY